MAAGAAGDRGGIFVVGAGIVGLCCAAFLQREGFAVTVADRDGPGEGCSSGNAGNIGVGTYPVANVVLKVPGMLLDPSHPLFIRWRDLPWLLPWFARYALANAPSRLAAIAAAIDSLHYPIFEAYDTLLAAAGARSLIRRDGLLFAYESRRGLESAQAGLDHYRRRGVVVRQLSGEEIRELEPALGRCIACGVFLEGTGQTVNPLRLSQTIAEHIVRNGGRLLRATVRGFETGDQGVRAVITDRGTHAVERLLIAAGLGSAALAAGLGARVPMAAERGYHVMLADPGVTLRRPVRFGERYIVAAPMEHGLRISGITEFARGEAAPDWRRAELVWRQAQPVLPGLRDVGATRWMGNRPSTPDWLPVIGRAPRFANAYFAFGHCHSGLSMGAVTGKIVGELVAGKPPSVDLAPFRPDRF